MSKINEAETLLNNIEKHPHYSKCFTGSEYNTFCNNRNKFYKCRNIYKEIIDLEGQIISDYYNKNNSEKKLNNLTQTTEKDIENLKQKMKLMEELNIQENENKLNDSKNKYQNNELNKDLELKELEKEISNLENEIKAEKAKYDNELNLKTKETKFKIENEYKIRLLQYTNKKKLELQEKEKDDAIKKKKFEADKEIEINGLKNKADFVKKVISIYKNISIN